MALRCSFNRVPVACWFPASGTVLWLRVRVRVCSLAEFCVVVSPMNRFGKHPIGGIDLSYSLFRFGLRRCAAGKSVRVVDFHKAAVRALDQLRACFSRYPQDFVMGCHASGASPCAALSAPSLADHRRSCSSIKFTPRRGQINRNRKSKVTYNCSFSRTHFLETRRRSTILLRAAGTPHTAAKPD